MLLAVVLAAGGKPAIGGPLELIATLPDGANVAALTTDAAGNLYVAGFIEPDEPRSAQDSRDVFVAKLTRGGSQLVYWTTFGGSDSDSGQAVAAGRDGSVYVTGTTTSRDFPATPGALQTDFQADGYQAFVAKLDADGKIEYQTLVGGSANTSGRDIFANQAGEVLVTGQSVGEGFPTTPGAAVASTAGNTTYAVKIDKSGGKLLLALRGAGGNRIAADAEDNIYIGGSALGQDPVPVTAGAFQTTHTVQACGGTGFVGIPCSYGYVAKLNAAGDKVVFATFVTGTFGSDIAAMQVDAGGNVLIAGTTNSRDYPVTPGALLDHYIANAEPPPHPLIGRPTIIPPPSAGYVTKLNNTGSGLLFSTYFGGRERDSITGMAAAGDAIYVAGNASSPDLPGLDVPGQCIPSPYVSQIAADGSAVVATRLVDRSPSHLQLGVAPGSGPYVAGVGASILRMDLKARAEGVACVLDAADLSHADTVTPGRLLSLFGKKLAGSIEAGTPAEDGLLPRLLGGLTVAFDGVAAPLLHVSPEQVNLQVPYEVAGAAAVTMEVVSAAMDDGDGGGDQPRRFAVVSRSPSAFLTPVPEHTCNDVTPQAAGGAHYPVARNADGSLNSCANPAAPGSQVSIFLHGAGVTQPPQATGAMTGDSGARLALPISFRSPEIEFVSAQNLPGAINSVWEVQFRLPQTSAGYAAVEPMVDGVKVAPGGLVIWVERH